MIQDANASNGQAVLEKSSFQIVRKHGGKRRKTDHLTVPEVRTYRAVEVKPSRPLLPTIFTP